VHADTATWTVTILLLVLGRFLWHSYQSASTLQRLNVLHSLLTVRRRGRAELANSSRTCSVVGQRSLWHCSKSDSKWSSFIVEQVSASVCCNFENTLSDSHGSVPSMSSSWRTLRSFAGSQVVNAAIAVSYRTLLACNECSLLSPQNVFLLNGSHLILQQWRILRNGVFQLFSLLTELINKPTWQKQTQRKSQPLWTAELQLNVWADAVCGRVVDINSVVCFCQMICWLTASVTNTWSLAENRPPLVPLV